MIYLCWHFEMATNTVYKPHTYMLYANKKQLVHIMAYIFQQKYEHYVFVRIGGALILGHGHLIGHMLHFKLYIFIIFILYTVVNKLNQIK